MRRSIPIILYMLCHIIISVSAQDYKYDAGGSLGLSSAYGDINQGQLMYNPKVSLSALLRVHRGLRWSHLYELESLGLAGYSSEFDNKFIDEKNYSFSSRLWQLSWSAEYNFLNYGWGYDYRNTSRLSPFLSLGVGVGVVSGNEQSALTLTIPIGVGIKYKFAPRWNFTARMVFAKTFTDKADGVKDPYNIESDGMKNTDWYSNLSFSISYEFGKFCIKCYNQ